MAAPTPTIALQAPVQHQLQGPVNQTTKTVRRSTFTLINHQLDRAPHSLSGYPQMLVVMALKIYHPNLGTGQLMESNTWII